MSAVLRVRDIASIHILQPTLTTEVVRLGERIRPHEKEIMSLPINTHARTTLDVEKMTAALYTFFQRASSAFLEQGASVSNDGQDAWLDYSYMFSDVEDLSAIYYDRAHYWDPVTESIGSAIAQDVLKVIGSRVNLQN